MSVFLHYDFWIIVRGFLTWLSISDRDSFLTMYDTYVDGLLLMIFCRIWYKSPQNAMQLKCLVSYRNQTRAKSSEFLTSNENVKDKQESSHKLIP